MRGTSKYEKKSWGFLTGTDGKDYFWSFQDIEGEGYKSLPVGDEVEFEPSKSEKGLKAINIKRLNVA